MSSPCCNKPFMHPRLADKIQELCARAIASTKQAEMEEAISELKAALKEHIHRMRERVISFPDRRSSAAD
jgi:predicted translin family RNA/ssDNA-binding protein